MYDYHSVYNWIPRFQTAKNSTSGSSGYYVGGSSTLPRGGQLMRAYSPAASSVVGGPNATPTQPKPLATPGTRKSATLETRSRKCSIYARTRSHVRVYRNKLCGMGVGSRVVSRQSRVAFTRLCTCHLLSPMLAPRVPCAVSRATTTRLSSRTLERGRRSTLQNAQLRPASSAST